MGDFNYPDINWELQEAGPGGIAFLDRIQDSFLIQNVSKPTRGENILDLVFSSEENMVSEMEIRCPVANSDHNVLTWHLIYENGEESEHGKRQQSFKYDKGNYQSFNQKLMDHDWDMLGDCKGIDAMSKVFTDEMILLRDELVPKNITSKTNKPRNLNKCILKRIKKR